MPAAITALLRQDRPVGGPVSLVAALTAVLMRGAQQAAARRRCGPSATADRDREDADADAHDHPDHLADGVGADVDLVEGAGRLAVLVGDDQPDRVDADGPASA